MTVPGGQEIKDCLKSMLDILPDSLLFVNPVRNHVLVSEALLIPVDRTVVLRSVAGRRPKVGYLSKILVTF